MLHGHREHADLGLGLFACGDLAPHDHHDLALAALTLVHIHLHVDGQAIAAPEAVFKAGLAIRHNGLHLGPELFGGELALHVGQRHAQQLLAAVAQVPAGRGIDRHETQALDVDQLDGIGRFLDHDVHQRLVVLFGAFGAAAAQHAREPGAHGLDQHFFLGQKSPAAFCRWPGGGHRELVHRAIAAIKGDGEGVGQLRGLRPADGSAVKQRMCPDFIGVAHGGRQPGHHLRNQGIGPDVIFFGHAEDVVKAGLLLDAFCQVGLHRFASHDVVAKGQAGSGHFGHEPVAAARQLLHLAHGLRVGFTIGQRAHRARQCAQALADGAADQEPAQHQHAANQCPHQGEHAGALIGECKLLLLRGFGVPKDGGDHIGSMFRDAGVVPGGFVHEPQALFGPGVGLLQGMDQALGVGLEILACGGGVVSPLVVMLHLAQFL